MILAADMREALSFYVDSNSVHSCVTDPPYGLKFMGKKWDYQVPPVDEWREVFRVLMPGAWLLAFGGTRTYHRLVCNIEDAGFEIRDQVQWIYGSGFPKSANGPWGGTALKPAHEPIVLARKPPLGTNAENFSELGVGGLNIDACRVEGTKGVPASPRRAAQGAAFGDLGNDPGTGSGWDSNTGRWPANVIHDGSSEVLEAFPEAPGQLADASSSSSRKFQRVYGAMKRSNGRLGEPSADAENNGIVGFKMRPGARREDAGSAARFFYCAKPSRRERDAGCAELPDPVGGMRSETSGQHITRRDGGDPAPVKNPHPTVKPVALMRYLCRLITPIGGTVLDPYMGSGTTGIAAKIEGLKFIGCDREPEFVRIAKARIGNTDMLQLSA